MSKILLKKEMPSKNIWSKTKKLQPKNLKVESINFLKKRFQELEVSAQENNKKIKTPTKRTESNKKEIWTLEIPEEIQANVQTIGKGTLLIFQTDRGILHHRLPYRFPLSVKKTGSGQIWKITGSPEKISWLPSRTSLDENIRMIYQILVGISRGYKKKLKMVGVGYKAFLEKNNGGDTSSQNKSHLKITLGYSHTNFLSLDPTISVKFSRKNNRVHLSGSSLPRLGETAALFHAMKKPDVYKGKGVRYRGLKLRKKEGKKQK